MAYKYTFNNDQNYLMHFNKNHSPKDGKFTSGDGDGDGQINDHAHRIKMQKKLNKALKKAEIASEAYEKSKKYQRVKNPYKESGYSDFVIYDMRKKETFEKYRKETEKIIKKIKDEGYTIDGYDSYLQYTEKELKGKKFVETSINGEKVRLEW